MQIKGVKTHPGTNSELSGHKVDCGFLLVVSKVCRSNDGNRASFRQFRLRFSTIDSICVFRCGFVPVIF